MQEDCLGDFEYPDNQDDEGLLEATPGCGAGDEPTWAYQDAGDEPDRAWDEPTKRRSRGKSK